MKRCIQEVSLGQIRCSRTEAGELLIGNRKAEDAMARIVDLRIKELGDEDTNAA
jgi:hypothetical protein